LLASSALTKRNPPPTAYNELFLFSEIQTREAPQAEFNFWKAKPHWLRKFKSVDPKLTINEHLGVLPTGILAK